MAIQVTPEIEGVNYVTISSNATTVVKNGPGTFFGFNVSTAGTAWTATVYDNTTGTGTVISSGNVALSLGYISAGAPPGFGINFQNGCTVVTSGTTAGSMIALFR